MKKNFLSILLLALINSQVFANCNSYTQINVPYEMDARDKKDLFKGIPSIIENELVAKGYRIIPRDSVKTREEMKKVADFELVIFQKTLRRFFSAPKYGTRLIHHGATDSQVIFSSALFSYSDLLGSPYELLGEIPSCETK